MSINVSYQRFSPEIFSRVTKDQGAWDALRRSDFSGKGETSSPLYSTSANPHGIGSGGTLQCRVASDVRVDLDKWWHVIAYLLTGQTEVTPGHRTGEPLRNAIFGGRQTRVVTGCGVVRSFANDDLRETAAALSQISDDALLRRWNVNAMGERELYGAPAGDYEREFLLDTFLGLKEFFVHAARERDIVVIYSH